MLAIVAAVVARPLAVIPRDAVLALLGWPERAILGWAGLRGAVPVVLATFPVIADVPRAEELFNIVFFAVVLSTIAQGTTFEPLARRLGVTTASPRCRGRSPRAAPSAASAPRSSSTRSPTTTRSSAIACATSACRATPSST